VIFIFYDKLNGKRYAQRECGAGGKSEYPPGKYFLGNEQVRVVEQVLVQILESRLEIQRQREGQQKAGNAPWAS
jgi:hypothetical protein